MVSNTQETRKAIARDDDSDADSVIRLEIYGVIVLAFSVALFMSLVTFDPRDMASQLSVRPERVGNAIGPIGAHIGHLFLGLMGLGSFVVCGIFSFLGASYIIGRRSAITMTDVMGWFGVLLGSVMLLHLWMAPTEILGHPAGGVGGEYITEIFKAFLSGPGTFLAASTLVLISLIALTRRSLVEVTGYVAQGARMGWSRARAAFARRGTPPETCDAPEPESDTEEPPILIGREGVRVEADPPATAPAKKPRKKSRVTDSPGASKQAAAAREQPGAIKISVRPPPSQPELQAVPEQGSLLLPPETPSPSDTEAKAVVSGAEPQGTAPVNSADELVPPEPASDAKDKGPSESAEDGDDLAIVESGAMKRSRDFEEEAELSIETVTKEYEFPSLQIIDYRPPEDGGICRETLTRNAALLEGKLADYKVMGKVVEIHPGPVVTMYEFLPAPGTKISKISNLSNDLAMALSALKIRIVAPIPGKNVVGIELPNAQREMVWLKEVLNDPSYSRAEGKLTLALGKDIVGNPAVMNLAKAPHVLVAGSTGSGKSVCINSFIVSLLYKSTPEEVRMIMVDPKMIELSIYEGIPHLLLPVVTDPKQAAIALRWAVKEMERRYRLLADLGVRGLDTYNAKVASLTADPLQPLPERLRLAKRKREAKGEFDPPGAVLDYTGEPLGNLPMIVVIIDELADLMMVASKDVETSIARLAQKARAAGIHLILATQRPSVDVITGVIKANLPTRISFLVASKVDSRTILDQSGAENLLGMGDMLYMPPGTSSLKRVHGSFISEEEVHRVVNHVKTQGSPEYDLGILVCDDEEDGPNPDRSGDDYDEFYDRAIQIVAETRNASISFLQRKLKIGYNRSARIIEKMEIEGIVGPSDGTSRPREVFIDPI